MAHEGTTLRFEGFRGRILLIEPTLPSDLPLVLRHRLTPQVSSLAEARRLSAAVRRSAHPPVDFHVEVDTGMGRVGFRPEDLLRDFPALLRLRGLRVEALYTHLATADWADGAHARRQIRSFHSLRDRLRPLLPPGLPAPGWHLANSAALLGRIPGAKGSWMRPGLALYGVAPHARLAKRLRLEPVLTFKARILQVKDLRKGDTVSYNRTFTAKRPMRVAVLAAGYADGVLRSLSNRGRCLIRGKVAPLVGTVCMDMCMADVTRVRGVKVGDAAVFFGREGRAVLPVAGQAAAAGTIPYELLCAIGPRVERVYV
jgi:alanine racemase